MKIVLLQHYSLISSNRQFLRQIISAQSHLLEFFSFIRFIGTQIPVKEEAGLVFIYCAVFFINHFLQLLNGEYRSIVVSLVNFFGFSQIKNNIGGKLIG